MPQIEEVQFVWWGPFRPDTIPLAIDVGARSVDPSIPTQVIFTKPADPRTVEYVTGKFC